MPASPRYCPACGAANPAENLLCFACRLPLDAPEEQEQHILLHERYRLLTQVGAGGFGGVYRAVDTAEARRIVAVKEINLRGLSAQEVIEATDGFYREVRLLSTLRHPNLPLIHDTFTDAEHWYLVMDFIEGETLEAYLKRKSGPGLPLEEALATGIQLCTVLDYLHTRQPAIVFRDLKPSNVMRTASGQLYLIDFGIARHFSPGKLRDTAPFGSPGYAAPEQYGRAQTTPQADIYSLGALLHHLVTGNDPAESPFHFAPLPVSASTEMAELDTLIQRMVAMETGERLASSAGVKMTLQRLAETLRRREYRALGDTAPPIARPAPVPTASAGITRRGLLTTGAKIGGIALGVAGVVGVAGLCELTLSFHPRVAGVVAMPPPSPGVAKQQLVYRGHTGAITALSWSPDGTMVASGSADRTVQVWRAADGALLYTLSGYDRPVTSVVWATDRKNVIASAGMSDGTVQVWDALRDHRDRIFHGDGRVLALSWQEKSPWIVSGGTDREIYTWNASSGKKGARYTGHKGEVRAVVWLPDMPGSATPGSVAPGSKIASGGADKTVQVWNAATGAHFLTYNGHTAGVNGLALLRYDPNEPTTYIVSASDDGTARVWSPVSGTQTVDTLTIYRGHRGKVNAVAALPPTNAFGPRVATASDDQTVQVWSLGAYIPATVYKEHHAPVKALAASPVDNRMVSGDAAGLIHLWTMSDPSYR